MNLVKQLMFVGLITATAGCGLFSDDGDPFDVSYTEEIPITFSIDAAVFCPSNADCSDPNNVAPAATTPPPFEAPGLPIDIIALTGNEELASAASRIKRVEIESVDYKYMNNTLNSEGPRVLIYLGPLGSASRSASGVVEIVDLPAVNVEGGSDEGKASVSDEKRDAASEVLKTLKITTIPLLSPAEIKKGDPYPSGTVDVELIMNVKFTVNPLDQI